MLTLFLLLFSVLPVACGVYAWSLIRSRDERDSDDPPPSPEPETPEPVVPPTLNRFDRHPAPPPRAHTGSKAPRPA